MRVEGPDSRYMMLWAGEWRAVTNMLDAHNFETTSVMRATRVVLYLGQGVWFATVVSPGEIMERPDRDPDAIEWEGETEY